MAQSIRAIVAPTISSDDNPNHTITLPTGLMTGDTVVLLIACDDAAPGTGNITWPAGSPTATVIVAEAATDWPNAGAQYVGPLSAADALNLSGGTITCLQDGATMSIVVLAGATNTIDFVTPSGGNYSASASQSIASANTTDNGEIVIAVFNGGTNTPNGFSASTWSTPSGWTNLGTGVSSYEMLGVFYLSMPTAGAIGTTASTISGTGGNMFGSFAFAFRNDANLQATNSAWLTA